MVVCDHQLRKLISDGDLGIDPFDENRIQPASIDLILDSEILIGNEKATDWLRPIDLGNLKETYAYHPLRKADITDSAYMVAPGEFLLASTKEYVKIPDFLVGRVEGKSSLGRIGLLIHATAGFIDPGFQGKITLELCNIGHRPIILRPDRAICQLSVLYLNSPCEKPYGHTDLGSHYQDQKSVTESRYEG